MSLRIVLRVMTLFGRLVELYEMFSLIKNFQTVFYVNRK
jgi:hypothetical protein